MQTTRIELDRKKARELYRAYKKHAHYSKPMDREAQRAYQLLAQGKLVIQAIESIKQAGLNEHHLPKLAIGPAIATDCFLERRHDGSMVMSSARWYRPGVKQIRFGEGSFTFPPNSFPMNQWEPTRRAWSSQHVAQTPMVPVHLRPKRGLQNYHVLWEAEWSPVPARDPYLLRRIGRADLWLVVAMWDLTEVERAILATRITVN